MIDKNSIKKFKVNTAVNNVVASPYILKKNASTPKMNNPVFTIGINIDANRLHLNELTDT